MGERIPLCCKTCNQVFREDLDEAKQYNKGNPFVCNTCKSKPKDPITPATVINFDDYVEARNQENHENAVDLLRRPAVLPAFADPDVNETIVREKHQRHHTPSPMFPHHPYDPNYHLHIENPLHTLEHYESIAVGEVKEKLDETRHRRERAEQDLRDEQRRVINYRDEGGGGHTWIWLIIGIVIILPIVILMFSILGNITSGLTSDINCFPLPGGKNAPPTNITNNWAKTCQDAKSNSSFIMMLLPIIIILFVIILVLRMVVMI